MAEYRPPGIPHGLGLPRLGPYLFDSITTRLRTPWGHWCCVREEEAVTASFSVTANTTETARPRRCSAPRILYRAATQAEKQKNANMLEAGGRAAPRRVSRSVVPWPRLRRDRHPSTSPRAVVHHVITATRREPSTTGCLLLGPKQTCAGRPGISPFDPTDIATIQTLRGCCV
jgi:hypothetical protein